MELHETDYVLMGSSSPDGWSYDPNDREDAGAVMALQRRGLVEVQAQSPRIHTATPTSRGWARIRDLRKQAASEAGVAFVEMNPTTMQWLGIGLGLGAVVAVGVYAWRRYAQGDSWQPKFAAGGEQR